MTDKQKVKKIKDLLEKAFDLCLTLPDNLQKLEFWNGGNYLQFANIIGYGSRVTDEMHRDYEEVISSN